MQCFSHHLGINIFSSVLDVWQSSSMMINFTFNSQSGLNERNKVNDLALESNLNETVNEVDIFGRAF